MAAFLRTAQLLAAVLLTGGPLFLLLVWRPALGTLGPDGLRPALAAPLERSCKAIASAAAAILAAASLADCLLLAAALSRAPLLAAGTLNTAVWLVTGSTAGILTMFRAVLATGILACTPWRPGHRLRNAGVVVLGASLLVTFSLTGHAAATPDNRVWPVLADLVHLLAAAAWYGGLCLFALLPWRNLQGGLGVAVLAAITNRFSNLGIAAMALVAVTGVYMAALRLYGVLALVEHRYGLTLLIKLVFLSGVLALAGLNLWVVRPRLNSGSGGKTRAAWLLRRFVAGEAALGLAVLAAAGALSTTAPPIGEPLRVSVTLSADPIAPQTAPQTLAIPVNKPIRLTATNAGSTTHACVVWKFPHDVIDGGHNRVAGQDMHIIREARAPGNRHVPGPTPWTVHGLLHGGRPLLRLAAVPLISRRTAPTAASVPHAVAP